MLRRLRFGQPPTTHHQPGTELPQQRHTKAEAEAVLRELPSVLGAFVREDVYGHPREVHLLVKSVTCAICWRRSSVSQSISA